MGFCSKNTTAVASVYNENASQETDILAYSTVCSVTVFK